MAPKVSNPIDSDLSEQIVSVKLRQLQEGDWKNRPDSVVCEEPLEIQVHGRSLSVLMRTPGHDEDLVSGFLMTEEIVEKWGDVDAMRHCTQAADLEAVDNVMQVRLGPGVELDFSKFSRHFFGSSSCGVCGKAALEQVMKRYQPIVDSIQMRADEFAGMMNRFTQTQAVFHRTGGLHGAALFNAAGEHLVTREDIGRHNAVDKVIGWSYREGYRNLEGTILLVSGRVSFEIVQKALAARIPMIAAVSAPSSLAVELAEQSNQTLLGFVRGETLNIYSRPERISLD